MASKSAPKTVTLTDPSGKDYQSSSAAEVVNLVYGSGYRIKGKQSVDEAIAGLAEQATAPTAGTTTKTSTTPAPSA